ncbi:MAG: winged helix-turn-helix domain-containing protein [Kineosporiaceae bacterium]|nr:winged helix-turn-helix domain-containing protein [Kineosporiaceae bacterium]
MMLRVLGPLQVDGPDGAVSVGGPVPRRILCALLVRPREVVPVDSLVDAAWGNAAPPSAERTLISHIARLREALARLDAAAPVQLERSNGGYRLMVAPQVVDATRFEQTLFGVSNLPAADAVPALLEATALWRPPAPFADLQDTTYPAAEAARLVELYGSAIEALAAAQLDAGDPVAAAAGAQARLREDPYRERLWELLILALYRQGRQGDALEAYQSARVELRDGLGVDPGPLLRRLEARVLAQDPGLLAGSAQIRRPCPYKGLARYDTADAALFVGRERLVDELAARLVDERFLVVVGPSGAGKSSLVRAGLVPALATGALPGSQDWGVSVIVPGPSRSRPWTARSPSGRRFWSSIRRKRRCSPMTARGWWRSATGCSRRSATVPGSCSCCVRTSSGCSPGTPCWPAGPDRRRCWWGRRTSRSCAGSSPTPRLGWDCGSNRRWRTWPWPRSVTGPGCCRCCPPRWCAPGSIAMGRP